MKPHFSRKLGKFFKPNLLKNKFYFRLERFYWILRHVYLDLMMWREFKLELSNEEQK